MRAVFGAVAVLLALASHNTQAHDIKPTRYPFLPELTVNNEPAVCGPFEAVVTEAFKRPQFHISIEGLEWPEADVTWLEFSDLGVATPVDNPYGGVEKFQGLLIDRNHDGRNEVLARAAWLYNWRGNINFLTIFPSLESFRKAKMLAEPVKPVPDERPKLAAVLNESSDMTPGTSSGREGKGTGLPGDEKVYWQWTWVERPVLKINGEVYLLDSGEAYDDDVTLSLWRIPSEGHPTIACTASLFTDDQGLSFGSLPPKSAQALEKVLRAISGEEVNGGTLHAHTSLLRDAGRNAARIALRPWSIARDGSYESRSAVDTALWIWAHTSIWNFHQYGNLQKLKLQTITDLAKYYRDDFGFEWGQAEKLANQGVALLIDGFFVFRGTWEERIETEPGLLENLRTIILNDPKASLLERKQPIAGVPENRNFDWQDWPLIDPSCYSEPRLFYALDHPRSLAILLPETNNLDDTNAFGKTALMYAAHLNLLESAKLLIAAGADVNKDTSMRRADESTWSCPSTWSRVSITKRTALMYALENAGPEMIELLLTVGADPNVEDSRSRGALDYLNLNTSILSSERKEIEAGLRAAGYEVVNAP